MVITIIATTSHPRPRLLEDSSREEVLVPSRISRKKRKKKGKKESDIYDAVIISLPRSFAAPSIRLIATRGWK